MFVMKHLFKHSFFQKILWVGLGLISLEGLAEDQEILQASAPRMMEGVRPQGMGGAFLAVSGRDENTIFYNPAAITEFDKKIKMQFVLPSVEITTKSINFFSKDVKNLIEDLDDATTDANRVDVFEAFANQNTGRYEAFGVRGAAAHLMHRYVTAAIFYEGMGAAALTNEVSARVKLETLAQAGVIVGSGFTLFDQQLKLGASLKFLGRHRINEVVTSYDVVKNDDFEDNLSYKDFGFGIGGDIGLKYTPKADNPLINSLKPSLALTLHDVGHTRFFMGDDVGRQKQSLGFGLALEPCTGIVCHTIALDLRDLEYRSEIINKAFMGYELSFPDLTKAIKNVYVRGGLYQGGLTAGVGIDLRYFKMNAATFTRQVAFVSDQKRLRYFSLQLAAGF